MKKALIVIAGLTAALIIAGCTSSTTNNTTPSGSAQNLNATLDAHFGARYTLIDNFTRLSEANETPIYSGDFQETNGTAHYVTIYLANSTTEAQGQFDDQKASYIDITATPNATVNANTSTHWAATSEDTLINVWLVQPKTAGPFGLSLDTPYVLVDMIPVGQTTESVVSATAGAG
jgi:hypothetical protein